MVDEVAILGVEEVVVAVKDIEKALEDFKSLFGFDFKVGWKLENEKIIIRSERINGVQFQLMQPTDKDSVVSSFLSRHGEGLHHIAFRVRGLDVIVDRLKRNGVKFIPDKPIEIESPLPEGGILRYIFIHPKYAHGVLIELIEFIESKDI